MTPEEILAFIPASLRDALGGALYTGLDSWTHASPLYLLGINPGGDPAGSRHTVLEHTLGLLGDESKRKYSAYRQEKWGNGRGGFYAEGMHPMQRSVLHLFDRLQFDPGLVPTSNIAYAASRTESHMGKSKMLAYAEDCWPFHATMMQRLQTMVVIAMGTTTANFVRTKVGAQDLVAEYRGENGRGNRSRIYTGGSVVVVHAAHPTRSSVWYTDRYDIVPLVQRALDMGANKSTRQPGSRQDRICR